MTVDWMSSSFWIDAACCSVFSRLNREAIIEKIPVTAAAETSPIALISSAIGDSQQRVRRESVFQLGHQ